jgi:hypothetical protein
MSYATNLSASGELLVFTVAAFGIAFLFEEFFVLSKVVTSISQNQASRMRKWRPGMADGR